MANRAAESSEHAAGTLEGRVLAGRYRVVGVLSAGANTIIADAVDLKAERPVTLKIVQPELAASEQFRRAFRRCVETASALRHPNIAGVTDWGETELAGESTVFWVVEHLAGGSLRELLDRGRWLTPSQALVVGLEACRALDAAHRHRVVHAEVTPSKLVFGVDRRLRIVDFATARLLGAEGWQDPATLPTQVARYASPEQAQGRKIGPKTDVYALSLSLLEAVTGKVPFAADSTSATLAARVDRLLPVSADLGSLASVLEHAARPDPEDRSTAAEFGRGLVQSAGRLPRPEPIPVLSTGLFDASELRRPSDPTGGFARPAGADAAGAVVAGAAGAATVAAGVAAGATEPPVPASESTEPPTEGPGEPASEPSAPGTDDPAAQDETDPGPPVPGDAPGDGQGGAADAPPVDDGPQSPVAADDPPPSAPPESPATPPEDVPAGSTDEADPPPDAGEEPPVESSGERVETGSLPASEPVAAVESSGERVETGSLPASEPVAAVESSGERVETGSLPATGPVAGGGPSGGRIDTGSIPATQPMPAAGGVALVPETDRLPVSEPSTAPATEPLRAMDPLVAPAPAAAIYDDERPRRRFLPIFLVTLLALAGIGALGYAGWLLLRTRSYEVPDLAGVDEQVARAEIEGNEWVVRTERVRDDDFPEPDTVVGSDPAAGEMLAEGAEFTLVVSDGPEFRTLPEFVDRPVDDVLATLDELALEGVEAPDRVFSEDVPDGAVVSWQVEGSPSLSAGGQVLPGEVVTLTVSKGPEPRPAPDMVGLTVAEAAAAADGVQLGLSQGEEVFSDDVAAGRVVSQEPPPETPVERGGTVTVQVSKGPDVIPLPDVIDLPFDRAQRVLNRNGFRVGDVLGTTDGNVVSISVDGERADVGSTYRRGTAVDVISL